MITFSDISLASASSLPCFDPGIQYSFRRCILRLLPNITPVAGKELMWTVTLRKVKVKEEVTPHSIDFHSYACDCGRTETQAYVKNFHISLHSKGLFYMFYTYVFNLCFYKDSAERDVISQLLQCPNKFLMLKF